MESTIYSTVIDGNNGLVWDDLDLVPQDNQPIQEIQPLEASIKINTIEKMRNYLSNKFNTNYYDVVLVKHNGSLFPTIIFINKLIQLGRIVIQTPLSQLYSQDEILISAITIINNNILTDLALDKLGVNIDDLYTIQRQLTLTHWSTPVIQE